MAQVIDIENIINCLFKSIFNVVQNSEQNIVTNILNMQKNINDDLLNKIDNRFKDIYKFIDKNKNIQQADIKRVRRGRNSVLTENKKYCNQERTQGRGKKQPVICINIMYVEIYLYHHQLPNHLKVMKNF